MKVKDIKESLGLTVLGAESSLNNDVSGAYMSDLLSDVMGNATEGQLWITLQNHKNVLAVAALKEMSGIIFIKGAKPDEDFIKLANEKNIALLYSDKPAFETAGKLYAILNK
ncbi:MAG: serine kinase [Bacteroidales bacterium]|jgi:predicted transcriptional regulator|nr:serine kinase [Bacteroidales bacterium]